MAPKGGGRGGGGRGGGSSGIGSTCSATGAFSNAAPIVAISFMAVYTLVFLVLPCMTSTRRKQCLARGHRKARTSWCGLYFSIICALLSMILFISVTVMRECQTGISEYAAVSYSQLWFQTVSVFALLVVVIVPICKQMHAVSGRIFSNLVGVAHIIYVVLLGIFMLAFLGFRTSWQFGTEWGYYSNRRLNAAIAINRGLSLTHDVFAFMGALLAAASIGFAVLRTSKLRSSGPVKMWAGILIPSVISLTVTELGYKIYTLGTLSNLTLDGWTAYVPLIGFFYTMTYIAALNLVSNDTVAGIEGSTQPANPAAKGYSQPTAQHPLLGQTTEYQGAVPQQQQQQQQPPQQQGPYEPMRTDYNNQAPNPPAPYYDASNQQPPQPQAYIPQYQQPQPQYNQGASQPHYG